MKLLTQLVASLAAVVVLACGGEHTLHALVEANASSQIKLRLENGADPNQKNQAGATPLILAVENKNSELVELLLKHGADPGLAGNDTEGNLEQPVTIASKLGFFKVVEQLVDAGAKVNCDDGWPLLYAVSRGHVDTVIFLLNKGADPNARDPHDASTVLHLACESAEYEIVKLLLKAGASKSSVNDAGLTPLETTVSAQLYRHDSLQSDLRKIIDLLKSEDADPMDL